MRMTTQSRYLLMKRARMAHNNQPGIVSLFEARHFFYTFRIIFISLNQVTHKHATHYQFAGNTESYIKGSRGVEISLGIAFRCNMHHSALHLITDYMEFVGDPTSGPIGQD
ncbi:hypothetical protein PILCRDRAFT_380601 [Piloderma croceum F 1598]|uniref:Uncharacterized protein n=1 Tax=Piloderma croceum (strain F 1598) TaxID=765440 RepID=A0A0C3G359_PILCF|nr:hypothetical protein PILCRDRAFT_380601 [Piloderma croceum F 1598]